MLISFMRHLLLLDGTCSKRHIFPGNFPWVISKPIGKVSMNQSQQRTRTSYWRGGKHCQATFCCRGRNHHH
ncbi:hypothetical protein XELAEV_18016872mg [Xenopus laevis]|uniref:Uncharacterized protein n=1 Tax=Xenopus laevis TaxID=8355 RepID=A0A974DAI4_XENLA|nr:hypothetical protein XELAEV_18016872mg [Xenopus laevis]